MAGTSATCGWCGRLANMAMFGDYGITVKSVLSSGGGVYKEVHEARRCDHCDGLSIVRRYGPARDVSSSIYHVQSESWFPQHVEGRDIQDVPELIASVASEAYQCASVGAFRGAVALARAVVEATAKFKGITSNGIASKINELHALGFIREHVREAAHEVRFGGNEIAHGDLAQEPLGKEEAEEILILMSEILLEVFQSPARVQRQRQKRLQRKKAEGVESPSDQ
ncbi:DUF4145 domain-containing protein [Streptomyces sp. NP-1717]|uniref:DUF4145 domain-containing protein n=1 Tax=Streptomyces sp. NP-1717 TaxID=2704470 RepID=UPI001F5CE48A|nr:DUF4145 domain-containing protein [Streptomyces sp. NP-1717]MCI3225839.1 DUF4145 domain-containing protein [Streptomyces sp. NP-1717]